MTAVVSMELTGPPGPRPRSLQWRLFYPDLLLRGEEGLRGARGPRPRSLQWRLFYPDLLLRGEEGLRGARGPCPQSCQCRLFYLDLLLRGEDVYEPEGHDRGRVHVHCSTWTSC